jgi:Protein of unknown function (DUF1353)
MIDTFPICGVHLQPGQFSTRIATVDTSDFRHFTNMDSVEYLSLDGELYRIPRLASSDLASIPRLFWTLLPPAGEDGAEYGLAAYGHDCCYQDTLLVWPTGAVPSGTPMPNDNTRWVKASLTKEKSDLLLREMMLACKVPADIVETIYEGVRLGGQHAFNEDRS